MSKKISWLLIAITFIGSFSFFSNFSEAKILISKIQIEGASTTDEFVELYNYSSSSASLFDWKLKKLTSGGTPSYLVSSFPSSTVLNPFSYFLIAHRDYAPINGVAADMQYSNNSTSLAANNSLLLFDEKNILIDEVDWGTVSSTARPAANPDAKKSLVRLPNTAEGNFIDTDNSGADFVVLDSFPFNSLSAARPMIVPVATDTTSTEIGIGGPPANLSTTIWTSLKLNEIMPNPDTGNEWVELFNISSSSVDLSGGSLCDSRTSTTCVIASLTGTIAARTWFPIYLTGSHLNNDGDSVLLKNPNGEIVDHVSYGNGKLLPTKGQSLARNSDGVDTGSDSDWSITETPTPGAANVISAPVVKPAIISGGGATIVSNPIETRFSKTSIPASATGTAAKNSVTLVWNLKIPTLIIAASSTLFDAHLSADPRGGEILMTWDFGDGQTADGAKIAHTFASSGIFTVIIHATSTAGTVGSKKLSVKVEPNTPIQTGIFLSGVAPRPETDDEEWIGLSSAATNTVDLSLWRLGTENDHWYVLPSGTSIAPGMTLKFFHAVSHLALNNDGSTIFLETPLTQIVDLVAYGKSLPGQTYTRGASGWEWLPKPEIISETKTTSTEKSAGAKKIYHTVTAAEARELSSGSLVFLTGTVESLPGMPGANYFFLRDQSGGIEIYSNKKLFPAMALGDTVQVLGEIGSIKNTVRVKTKFEGAIKKIKNGNISQPEQKSISEIDENNYGMLVSLEGEITKIKNSFFYLDDGAEAEIILSKNSGIDKKSLREGDRIRVAGIVNQTNPTIRILPRQPADLTILESKIPTDISSSAVSSTSKVVAGTGGGLALLGLTWAVKKWLIK